MSGDSVDATAPTKSADEVIHGSQSFWPVVGTITENISVHRELGGDGAGGSSGLYGTLGEKVRRELPDSDVIRHIWSSIKRNE